MGSLIRHVSSAAPGIRREAGQCAEYTGRTVQGILLPRLRLISEPERDEGTVLPLIPPQISQPATDEAIRSLVALEMKLSGNLITPTLHGEYYYNKPPLYNWILFQ